MRLKSSAFALRFMVIFCAVVFMFIMVGRIEFEHNGTIVDIDRTLSEDVREASRRVLKISAKTIATAEVHLNPARLARGFLNDTHRQDMVGMIYSGGSQSLESRIVSVPSVLLKTQPSEDHL